jgi:two-component system LytT family sensor kinase
MSTNSLGLTRSKQFWIFPLLGWALWAFMIVLRDLFFVPSEYILSRALIFSLSAAAGIIVTAGLRFTYRWVWERGFVIRFLVAWFGSFAAALIWQPFQNFIALLPFGEVADFSITNTEDLFDGVFRASFPLMLVWSGLYFIIKYYQLFQAEKEKSLRSEALAHQAQLLMLRYQLNPHFLFNTLNAISTLVLAQATEQANEMLTKLSKFLRYSLDHSPLDRVSLAHEVDSSRLYLDIEKVRFGERLKLEFDLDREVENALVPTMLLQPIVENSIKHAVSKSESGGTIRIGARRAGSFLRLEVSDDGPGLPQNGASREGYTLSPGVGVSNIRNRLREIYGDRHKLVFSNVATGGLMVTVEIPYDTE